MLIRTFGSQVEAKQVCDVVSLASESYPHLTGLELADYATKEDTFTV